MQQEQIRLIKEISDAEQRQASAEEKQAKKKETKQKVASATPQSVDDATNMPVGLGLLFLVLAAWIQYQHGQNGFAMQFNFLTIYLVFGLLYGAAKAVLVKATLHEYLRRILREVLIFAVAGFGIPVLINQAFTGWLNFSSALAVEPFFVFALVVFPPVVLYIMKEMRGAWATLATGYVFIWLVVILFFAVTVFTLPFEDSYQQLDVAGNVAEAWDIILDTFDQAISVTADVLNESSRRLDPNYYVGQVEQNEERPLGVRLEDVEPVSPIFYPAEPVFIRGFIAAETFLEDSVHVNLACSERDRNESEVYSEGYEVYYGHDEFFECEFPNGFDSGSYTIDVEATFPFETWADVTYDFITEEKSRTLARLGVDVYQELNIPREPQAIYTNGPVMLGMAKAGSRLPIIVTQEEPYLRNAYVGFSLESKWPRGKINRVEEMELIIPDSFVLLSCDRYYGSVTGPLPDDNAPGYHKYIMKNVYDGQSAFTSVSCKMGLTSADALPGLVANDKVTRTFIARARYDYTLVDDVRIRVAG